MNIPQTYEFYKELRALKDAGKTGEYDILRRQHPEHLSLEKMEELVKYIEEKAKHGETTPTKPRINMLAGRPFHLRINKRQASED